MKKLSDMPNISKVITEKLEEAGIHSPEELIALGSKNAFTKIRIIDPEACINMLYGLEGAIEGIRWHNLSDEKKDELKVFFRSL